MRILGIDWGHKRIGLALSDELNRIAFPYKVLQYNSEDNIFQKLEQEIQEKKVALIVLGLPLNMDGSIGDSAKKVLEFKKKLEEKLKIQVFTCDERLSSLVSENALLAFDLSRKKRKGIKDKIAAAQILQTYLDKTNRSA